MATTPKKSTGSGVSVQISTDGTSFKTFGSVTKISPPNMTRGTIDVTDLNSYANNDKMKEYLADFIEADEVSVEGFFLDTDEGRDQAETAFYSDNECYIKIVLPAAIGKTMTVKGVPTAYQPLGDIDASNGIPFSFKMKPTAKPTLASSGT